MPTFFCSHSQHAGNEVMYDHIVTINADKYTVADDEGIVTGTHILWNIFLILGHKLKQFALYTY